MSKTKLGSNATYTGSQLGLTVVGEDAYAYSGPVAVADTSVTLLQFTTGKFYINANWIGNYNQNVSETLASEDYRFTIALNGTRIASCESSDAQGSARNTVLNIIIPPLTEVKVEARNYSGSGTEDVGAVIVGKVING